MKELRRWVGELLPRLCRTPRRLERGLRRSCFSGDDDSEVVVASTVDSGSTLAGAGVAAGIPGVLVSILAV